jgi:hypothetical protein
MGGFKPIGSEKLEGMDKLKRIMEIARYKENIPQSVNETKSNEYSIELADNNIYQIEKERQGYIIKKYISESVSEYIDPMKSRRYYSSYSQALKRLNLMAKEINVLHENEEGISLIGEQKKKFILKTKKKNVAEPAAETPPPPVPAPEPAEVPPAPITEPTPEMTAPEEGGVPSDDEIPMGIPGEDTETPPNEMGLEPPMDNMDMPSDEVPTDEVEDETEIEIEKKPKEKKVSDLKRIQILVGKLAQKIRSYEEEKELSPKEIKYIINSILSAIDVDVLDEDDIEQIINKLEGTDEGDEEDKGSDEDEFSFEEESDEEEISPEPPKEPEMTERFEKFSDAYENYLSSNIAGLSAKGLSTEMSEDDEPYEDLYRRKRGSRSHFYPEVDHFTHGTFSESSVDKVLSKYFILSESQEQNYKKQKDKKTNELYKINKKNIIKLAESNQQLNAAINYIDENPRSKILGISNKGNLIFKEGINQVSITKTGRII